MTKKMKYGVIVGKRKAEVYQKEVPSIKEDEVLINNKTCNICTTDYQQWAGDRMHQPFPMAFGHENSGIVVEVGKEVKNCQPGDHVVVNIYGPCLECDNCRMGKSSIYCQNSLSNYKMKHPDEDGVYGFYGCGEYQVAKSKHVFKVSKDLPFEEAGFVEPLATVIHGIERLRIKVKEKVLVIGAGTMGLLNAQVARYYGADVIISELIDKKIEAAKKLKFDQIINPEKENFQEKIKEYLGDSQLDAIIVAVGATSAYNQAIKVAPKGCRMLIFAANFPEPDWDLKPNPVHYQLWEIIGTYGCSTQDYLNATVLLSKKYILTAPLLEKKYSLEDIQKAFEKATTPGTYRVTIEI
ncbi:MAG: alcohol dehydrogenase catalytic domain-containing protein [Candidatus Atribacteria bacterium]|nr:alcohol dehydrogenase catalytic domain-containing protein [Candidatus Atribacteria bacterium]